MMNAFIRAIAAIAVLVALPAIATPKHKVATGLWIKADESGWGLSLLQVN